MTTIKIALEWFLNPDHLPIVNAIETGLYKDAGINVEIIEPTDHYDGFKDLLDRNIDIHCNEPLHLFEHYFEGLKSLGCFFETRGGVMIRKSSFEKLKNGEKLRITTPASNEITDKIGYEILKRFCAKHNYPSERSNVEFVQNDFYHVANMQKDESLDGAWLCFYNFEGVEAEMEKFDNVFIDQNESPFPNFSALEFMTTEATVKDKKEALKTFIEVTEKSAASIIKDMELAKKSYYSYSKEEQSELMDKIIEDTLTRLETTIQPSNTRWKSLQRFLEELEVVKLTEEQYKNIWV